MARHCPERGSWNQALKVCSFRRSLGSPCHRSQSHRSKAHASSVLLRPARRALLARCVDWLLTLVTEAELSKALAGVVTCSIKAFARPASIALAIRCSASRANLGACTLCREFLRRFTEANCCKAIACLVLRWPARWALLAGCVDWLLTLLTEAELSKALTSVVTCFIQALAGPAPFITFACWTGARRANALALASFWKFLWRLAEADRRETVACFVLCWPTRWAFLSWGVDWFLPLLAEAKLCKAGACAVRCVV